MASSSGPLNEELQCFICLDLFTDPVTTPCGHSFCRTCLNKFWTETQTCFCPLCKETLISRPDLKINTSMYGGMGEGEVRMIQTALVREWAQNATSSEGDKPTPAPPNGISTEGNNPTSRSTPPNSIPKEKKTTPASPNANSAEGPSQYAIQGARKP